MGCCGSKEPANKYAVDNKSSAPTAKSANAASSGAAKSSGPRLPDFGIGELYENLMPLGKGGTGETYLMREKGTDLLVAIKVIPRPIPGPIIEMLKREIEIQGFLGEGHLNIINAYEVILSETHLALVMEYASGGSLTTYVSKRYETNEDTLGRAKGLYLTEDEALYFFRQFISAVEYCHRHNVMHRDLKLDNTLLDGSDPPYIKICDFGFAKAWEDGGEANTRTIIGTPVYMSPEVLSSGVSHKAYDGKAADVWSSGVMLFVMLMGAFPYDHIQNPDPDSQAAHREVLLQQITNSWSDCIGSPLIKHLVKLLSPSCRDLLDRLFVTDSKKRVTLEDVKSHPWFNRKLPDRYERALNRLFAQQEQLDDRAKELDMDKRKARSTAVRKLIDDAGRRANNVASTAIAEDEEESDMVTQGKLKRINLRMNLDTFTKDKTFSDYVATKKGGKEMLNYERNF